MIKKIFTKRLVLRPWDASDAESLYEYAKDPSIGPMSGWPVHTSLENSREIIRDVLSVDGTFAVTIKGNTVAIGSIGLMIGDNSNLGLSDLEAEIGYWIGVPFWGNGYIPEAVQELLRYGFEELRLAAIWCGYFDGNDKSKRVSEKYDFRFVRTEKKELPLIGETKLEHITCITKDKWFNHIL